MSATIVGENPQESPTAAQITAIYRALTGRRYRPVNETRVQHDVAIALADTGLHVAAEHRLSSRDRPDFIVAGRIAVEVKIKGSTNDVLRQLARYAQHHTVAAVILATTSRRLAATAPTTLSGKPVQVCVLPGVAL